MNVVIVRPSKSPPSETLSPAPGHTSGDGRLCQSRTCVHHCSVVGGDGTVPERCWPRFVEFIPCVRPGRTVKVHVGGRTWADAGATTLALRVSGQDTAKTRVCARAGAMHGCYQERDDPGGGNTRSGVTRLPA